MLFCWLSTCIYQLVIKANIYPACKKFNHTSKLAFIYVLMANIQCGQIIIFQNFAFWVLYNPSHKVPLNDRKTNIIEHCSNVILLTFNMNFPTGTQAVAKSQKNKIEAMHQCTNVTGLILAWTKFGARPFWHFWCGEIFAEGFFFKSRHRFNLA